MRHSLADDLSVSKSVRDNFRLDLHELGELVASSLSVRDVFRCIANRVCEYLDCEGARLFLLDQDRTHLVKAAAWGLECEQARGGSELSFRCFNEKTILAEAYGDVSSGSELIALPLTRGTETIGVLELYLNSFAQLPDRSAVALAMVRDLVSPVIVQAMIYERNIARSNLDPITDLPNDRAFYTRCESMISDAVGQHRALSVVVFDVNNFASISDRLGHAAGEALLKKVAHVVRRYLRDMDLMARSHSDEFLVLLPTATEQEAMAVISRIRDGISDNETERVYDTVGPISLNFGWAVLGDDGDSISTLLRRAKLRRDRSKEKGTNENLLIFPSRKQILDRA